MTDENVQNITSLPDNIIPAKPNPTYELEREANHAIDYLTKFTKNPRLDPELRMALSDIKNTVKMLKTTVVHMTEQAQLHHDNMVEIVRSQRLM